MPKRGSRLIALLAAAGTLASCVSLEEQKLPKNSVQPDQRTVLLVFASPGPVYTEDDSKAETAAKIVPGLGIVVKSVQDDSATKRSKDLQKYLPFWDPAAEFKPLLVKELANSGHPGKWVDVSELQELGADKLKLYNRADDVLDWQLRYYIDNPDHPVPRNYSTLLSLDDALIFEVDLEYQVQAGDEDRATPALSAVTKLVRANTSHVIWRHEDVAVDNAGARTTYEFKVQPEDLVAKYRKLMTPLAQAVVASYRKNLQEAGLLRMPAYAPAAPSGAPPAMPYGMSPAPNAPPPMPYGMAPPPPVPPSPAEQAEAARQTAPPAVAPSTTTAH